MIYKKGSRLRGSVSEGTVHRLNSTVKAFDTIISAKLCSFEQEA